MKCLRATTADIARRGLSDRAVASQRGS